ncbi:MAG TPA: hypothetical protein VH044_16255 [Polyangiaceae bacterium]|nr:hypothetical protein [Polyangiaceae bacterium]
MMNFIFEVKRYCKPLSLSVRFVSMLLRYPLLLSALAFAAVACTACSAASSGDPNTGSSPDGGALDETTFIAQEADFSGFCHWQAAPATAEGDASDGIHGLGPLTVYINKKPPSGSREFPVGTIILKESMQADPSQRVAFAMVKRQASGNTWNATGAKGWEWWSVTDNGDCTISKLWRGAYAPAGETYAGNPAGDCNGCHGQVAGNDYVWDTALRLSSL